MSRENGRASAGVSQNNFVLDFVHEGPKNPTLKAGETKDLGELKVKPRK
jgi:hypothetical protein